MNWTARGVYDLYLQAQRQSGTEGKDWVELTPDQMRHWVDFARLLRDAAKGTPQ